MGTFRQSLAVIIWMTFYIKLEAMVQYVNKMGHRSRPGWARAHPAPAPPGSAYTIDDDHFVVTKVETIVIPLAQLKTARGTTPPPYNMHKFSFEEDMIPFLKPEAQASPMTEDKRAVYVSNKQKYSTVQRGHIIGLKLGGPQDLRNIILQTAGWQASPGPYGYMEDEIYDFAFKKYRLRDPYNYEDTHLPHKPSAPTYLVKMTVDIEYDAHMRFPIRYKISVTCQDGDSLAISNIVQPTFVESAPITITHSSSAGSSRTALTVPQQATKRQRVDPGIKANEYFVEFVDDPWEQKECEKEFAIAMLIATDVVLIFIIVCCVMLLPLIAYYFFGCKNDQFSVYHNK